MSTRQFAVRCARTTTPDAPLPPSPSMAEQLRAELTAGGLEEVVVVAKRSTALPPLDVAVWVEPDEPLHPRAGIVHALERADGRAVLACAVDLPLVTPLLVSTIAHADGTIAVVPRAGGRLQPLLARYEPAALGALRAAPADEPLTATVEALGPSVLEIAEDEAFMNANTPEELAEIAQRIARR